ncbi:MAG TPA: hydroxyacid dehydrogenase [Clostridia bacterium]|jgi:D-3-phosphoglycerate dehydrogenase|nr:hydroxyacid dehydrogenase [Clostridia bacterium]HPY44082.1 hydroxyacid dehydrogenase [Clostridia bacterium]HQA98257.1 hydroxyacid dehydrogenase [Clostridia bacterium]HUM60575.1 hydroxyacid dehydrogenase [Clostridia bacterium]
MYKVLLTERIDKTGIDILSKVAQVDIAPDPSEKTIVSMVGDYDAMIIRATLLTEPMLAAGKKLKVVGRHGVGTDNLDIPAATRHGILLLNTPGANAGSVAEYTVGALLYLFKRFAEADRMLRRGDFNQPGSLTGLLTKLGFENRVVEGRTIGLAGFGAIARRVAKICIHGFDMKVLAYDPYVSEKAMNALGVQKVASVKEMAPLVDALTIHVPKTPETVNLINSEIFSAMKPTAVLVNAARGGIVNEADLVEALKNRSIAAAATDVYDQEPPPMDHPLFALDNMLMTPHIGAASDGAMQNMASYVARGVVDVLEGRTPQFVVNRELLKKDG